MDRISKCCEQKKTTKQLAWLEFEMFALHHLVISRIGKMIQMQCNVVGKRNKPINVHGAIMVCI
jgi:hypothetical protein